MQITYLIIADLLSVGGAFFAAYHLRRALPLPPVQALAFYALFLFSAVALLILSFKLFRLYREERIHSLDYFADFLRALALWGLFLAAFSFLTKTDYSRILTILFFCFALPLIYLGRLFIAYSMSPSCKTDEDAKIRSRCEDAAQSLRAQAESNTETRAPTDGWAASFSLIQWGERFFDAACAPLALAVLLPFFPIIAWLIRRDSPGRAIIRQERVGLGGKNFMLYKFRTMRTDTPLYAPSPTGSEDARITKIGALLRKYSIDEIPQFWNVLKGDMAIVGPRPEMPFIVEGYAPWQRLRLTVKPGITGLWQILGRKDLPLAEHLEYDIYYVLHRSFFLDLAIILKTIPHLILPRGAY
ncbi:MAG: sugar transferase [Patescibacteria group bacterium]